MSDADATGTPHDSAAEAFVHRVRDDGVQGVEQLVLFGSTARDDATGLDSDVDFLVVLSDTADRRAVEDRVRDIAYDVMLEYGPVVELHFLSETRFEQHRTSGHRSSRTSCERAGRMPDGDEPGEEHVQQQIRQAQQAVADATGARDAGLSDAVVVNRLYYACFHAAQAVLYDRDHNPTSHGAVLSLFGSEVVVEGDASRERGRFLNQLSELRRQGDYGYAPIEENVDGLLATTREFVEEMETLVAEE